VANRCGSRKNRNDVADDIDGLLVLVKAISYFKSSKAGCRGLLSV
jgi:hypothetical protein